MNFFGGVGLVEVEGIGLVFVLVFCAEEEGG